MSRPSRFFVSAIFLAGALSFTGCVGTLYDDMYSNRKTHFKPPEEKKETSAESILGALDTKPGGAGADAALPPAGDVPGLPPAGLPDAGAGGLPAPAAPSAPAAPPAQ
jgi:hypothetical protein